MHHLPPTYCCEHIEALLEVNVSLVVEVVVHQHVLGPVGHILKLIIQRGVLQQQLVRQRQHLRRG